MRSDARTRLQAAIIHDLASSMGSDQLLLAAMRLSLRAGGEVDLPDSERRLYLRIAASLEELRESRERDEAEQARGSATWTMTTREAETFLEAARFAARHAGEADPDLARRARRLARHFELADPVSGERVEDADSTEAFLRAFG